MDGLPPDDPHAAAACWPAGEYGDPTPGPRRPRVRWSRPTQRPAARPRARGRRAARHGHLPADARPPRARRARAARGGGEPVRERHRPRRRDRRALPRRRDRGADGVDDLDLAANGLGRDRARSLRPAARLSTTRTGCGGRRTATDGDVSELDRARRAGRRSRLRQRDPRGAPLPARGRPDQRAGAAGADALADAADGRRTVDQIGVVPPGRVPRESEASRSAHRRPRRGRQPAARRPGRRRRTARPPGAAPRAGSSPPWSR